MNIKTFYFNPYRECTYILTGGPADFLSEGQTAVIDPGMYSDREQQRLMDYLKEQNLTLSLILITHAHPDHVCGKDFLLNQFPDIPVIDSEHVVMNRGFRMIATPGHKEDSVCYYFEEEGIIFTGDTLFQESIGRTDLPGGDMLQLVKSLNLLKQLPDTTAVYPGHGYPTTIAHEKEYNPYM